MKALQSWEQDGHQPAFSLPRAHAVATRPDPSEQSKVKLEPATSFSSLVPRPGLISATGSPRANVLGTRTQKVTEVLALPGARG